MSEGTERTEVWPSPREWSSHTRPGQALDDSTVVSAAFFDRLVGTLDEADVTPDLTETVTQARRSARIVAQ